MAPLLLVPELVWPWARGSAPRPGWFQPEAVAARDGLVLLALAIVAWTAARRPLGRGRAAAVLLAVAPLWTLHVTDTAMTVTEDFRSSITGLTWIASGTLGGLAAIAVLARWSEARGRLPRLPDDLWHAIGRLLLAFELVWAYCAYDQLHVIWMADEPSEARWYLVRTAGGWAAWTWVLGLGHAAAFVPLLSRELKRSREVVAAVAALLLALRLVEAGWAVGAEGGPAGRVLVALLPAALAVGGGSLAIGLALGPRAPDPLREQSLAYRSA